MTSQHVRARQRPSKSTELRLARCREQLRRWRLPGYLLTNRTDQIYLTGFTGEDGAALITPRRVYLITDGRFAETADLEAPWAIKVVRTGDLAAAAARTVKRCGIRKLSVQADHTSLRMYQQLRRALRPTRVVTAPPIVNQLRLCKDEEEINRLRQAVRVAQQAFHAILRAIRIGIAEREVAAKLEFEMRRRGATSASFPVVVAAGANASQPHARAGAGEIRSGCTLLLDWGAEVDFYRSDLTRVVFIGRIPARFRRVYEVVLEAQRRAIDAIRPGVRTCDVDAAARAYVRAAGFGDYFVHGLGHGIGLDVHEPPRLNRQSKDRLEAGMVVTVEPRVYLPGAGGVRIEDDVLVTPDGYEVLSDLPKDIGAARL